MQHNNFLHVIAHMALQSPLLGLYMETASHHGTISQLHCLPFYHETGGLPKHILQVCLVCAGKVNDG